MIQNTNSRIAVCNHLLLLFALFMGITALAQTDYQEIPLEGNPITVKNRKSLLENAPNILEGIGSSTGQTSTSSFATGGGGISETMGELSVSLNGGSNYKVPLKLPLGINGVQPEIAITYDSHAGNGLAGFGWNIGGVSVIARIASTKYHDNIIDPVDFDNLDRFALDGQRLVLKSGTYGGDGAVYETENYSNLKIVSYGTSPYGTSYGPEKFTVFYPDGSIARYGYSTDSRSRTNFAITSWENPQGVRIDYEYVAADNNISISSIKYGHRTGGTAPNSINFRYKSRQRGEQAFIGGIDFRRKNILSEINIRTGSVGYRNYVLDHFKNTLGYERVRTITEKSGDNSLSYSPITFGYDDTPSTISSVLEIDTRLNVNNIEYRNAKVIPLDYDGDGEMDFIVYPKDKSERTKFWIFSNLRSGSDNIGGTVDTTVFEDMFPINYLNASSRLDKAQGFALVTHSGSNQVKFKINGQSSYGPAAQYYEKTWTAPTRISDYNCDQDNLSVAPMTYLSGDFNGDGLTDVVAVTEPYTNTWCNRPNGCDNDPDPRDDPNGEDEDGNNYATPAENVDPALQSANNVGDCACSCTSSDYNIGNAYFIDLDRRSTTNFTKSLGGLSAPWEDDMTLKTADVNGDGRTDILQFVEGKVYVYSLSANNDLQLLWVHTDSRIKPEYDPMLGDYNGDGKTDFMYPTGTNSDRFALFRSTGKQFVKNEATYPFRYRLSTTATSPVSTYNLIATDINNDGRTDILDYSTRTQNDGTGGVQTVTMYYNTVPETTELTPEFILIQSNNISSDLNHFPIPVFLSSEDKENDNLDFATISNNRVFSFRFGKDNRSDLLLRSVFNNGVRHEISYASMDPLARRDDGSLIYYPKTVLNYPYVALNVSKGTKLVSEIVRKVNGTPTIRKLFSYEGGTANAVGLGFMGFAGRADTEWHIDNSDRIWNVQKRSMSYRGALTRSYTIPYTLNFNTVPSDYIVRTDYDYEGVIYTNRVFKMWNVSKTVQNRLSGTAITTSYLYDDYNNVTRATTDYNGDGSSLVEMSYSNNTGSNYHIGRLLTRKETNTVHGDSFGSEEQYTYSGYLLATKKTKGNGTEFDTDTYTYDPYGNLTRHTSTPHGSSARNLQFEYDPSGRYMIKSTDVENRVNRFEYDTNAGTLRRQTSANGLTSEFGYDRFHRLIKVTDYLGNETNTSYSESDYFYDVQNRAADGGFSVIQYDPLKRVVKTSVKNVLGEWVKQSFEYDKFDRPYRESEPYKGNAATQWTTTEYDFYGRPKTMTMHTGRVTNITYSGLSTTVNDGTKSVTTTRDAMGNIVRVTDPGGTIDYTYYGNGALKSSNFEGIVLQFEQDGWGRKTKLIDPSAGTYTYSYNGFGQLTQETTPKGTTDYSYSSVGKLTQKKITGDAGTDMTMAYSYNSDKLLSMVTLTNADGNNGTTTYAYDSYKRLLSTVEANSYARFSKNYEYDSFGRVTAEESEAQLLANNERSTTKVRNTYAYGQLLSINDHTTGEELFKIDALSSRGQLEAATMGNGLRQTNTYDSYGYVSEVSAERNVNETPTEVMTLTYEFDAQRGTLNKRSNSLFSWNETFVYDDLDRLESYSDNNGASSQEYDGKGRIGTISELGTFSYASNSFQPSGVDFNKAGEANYEKYTRQQVTYNAFKSPTEIKEEGREHISFQYNANGDRANTFYGGTDDDIAQRPYRRHYSEDGTMEISHDRNSAKTSFVTYVGGDAYTATAIRHEVHTATNSSAAYLYLHRDYLGSILAITDKDGDIKEKRHFDAWGKIVKWVDGDDRDLAKGFASGGILDRGYTGHEHLFGLGLIHMNGRLYDPLLHRFLMPDNFIQDPYNTQNYNRYSYVLNNPLMYVDPSGEFAEIGIGVIIAYIAVAAAAVVGVAAFVDIYTDTGSSADIPDRAPTPSAGQNSSQEIASNLGPIEGQIHNLNIPLGIGQEMSYLSPEALRAGSGSSGSSALENFNPFKTVEEPLEEPSSDWGTSLLDGFQTVLDVAGLVPVVGEVADGINALIYLGRGDYLNASLSAAAMVPIAGWAATGGKLGAKVFKATKGSGNVLRHYTSKEGYNAIMKSKTLNPSIGSKNARHGSGQYFTDLASEGLSAGQVSRQLFGVPWNGRKVSHFIDIDVGGLNVIKNGPGNYLVPGTNGLPLDDRIINHGATIFK